MLEASDGLRAARDPFSQNELLFGQLLDTVFERVSACLSLGLDHAVEQRFDLALGITDLLAQGVDTANHILAARLPGAREHVGSKAQERRVGSEGFKQPFELAFDLIAANGFAVVIARIVVAKIIRVMRVAPLRPRSRQRLTASAVHAASEREVRTQIFSRWRALVAIEAGDNPAVRFQADQCLMPSLAKTYAPIRC